MDNDWTEEEITAVLQESATDERRKLYGLSPSNLARMVLDARHDNKKELVDAAWSGTMDLNLRAPNRGIKRFIRIIFVVLLPAWFEEMKLAWKSRNYPFKTVYFRHAMAMKTLEHVITLTPVIQGLRDAMHTYDDELSKQREENASRNNNED